MALSSVGFLALRLMIDKFSRKINCRDCPLKISGMISIRLADKV